MLRLCISQHIKVNWWALDWVCIIMNEFVLSFCFNVKADGPGFGSRLRAFEIFMTFLKYLIIDGLHHNCNKKHVKYCDIFRKKIATLKIQNVKFFIDALSHYHVWLSYSIINWQCKNKYFYFRQKSIDNFWVLVGNFFCRHLIHFFWIETL